MMSSLWQPSVDVFHSGEFWFVKVELAGVRPEQLSISANGNTLILKGQRKDLSRRSGCSYHTLEISYSSFERCLSLPVAIQPASLAWDYSNGMLLIQFRPQ